MERVIETMERAMQVLRDEMAAIDSELWDDKREFWRTKCPDLGKEMDEKEDVYGKLDAILVEMIDLAEQ